MKNFINLGSIFFQAEKYGLLTTKTEWLFIVTDANQSPVEFFIPPEMLGREDGRNIAVLYNNSRYDQNHCQVSIATGTIVSKKISYI